MEEARHDRAGGRLGAPLSAEPLGTSPVADQTLLAGPQTNLLHVGPGPLGPRKGLRVVPLRAGGQNGREVHPHLGR